MKKIIALFLLMGMAILTGCSQEPAKDTSAVPATKAEQPVKNEKLPEKEPEYADVVLYFSDNQGIKLHPETRNILKEDAQNPEYVLKELIGGTQNTQEYYDIIPSTTKVNSCTVEKDGLCKIDLSKDFLDIQGDAAKEMAIYSIVNTLCSIEGVEQVEFFIDGEKVELFGYYDLLNPFEADMEFVAE